MLKTSLEGNLTLERVQRNQSGTYGCRVEDFDVPEDAELSKTLELRVAYLDSLELSAGEELSLPLHNSTTVTCSARGLPTPTLYWTKDSAPMGRTPHSPSTPSPSIQPAPTHVRPTCPGSPS